MTVMTRRDFLHSTAVASAAAIAVRAHVASAVESPSEEIQAAVIGLGRGLGHMSALLEAENTRITYLVDVDSQRRERGMKAVESKLREKQRDQPLPTPLGDLREALDDPKLNAVFIATCNHWHAPAAILACKAGKHVYVEKPGSHNAREGELLVAAARQHQRVVQMGNQRRTWPGIREGIQRVHDGAIGKVLYARCWYHSQRGGIGRGQPAEVPAHLDYTLWQGPAPERPYKDNLVHYNWHWHWHYGGGEMANNGIHSLDVARWGLQVDYPVSVSFHGGRYHFDDDQETPDTGTAVFDFGDVGCSWEGSSCHARRGEPLPTVAFYGTEGLMHIIDPGYVQFDLAGKKVAEGRGAGGDQDHINNFLQAIRTGSALNSEIEEGQKSTLLCHLANISYRTGRRLQFNPTTRQIEGDTDALQYWSREYRPGWEPTVT
jgi:predicted dehydrogenase